MSSLALTTSEHSYSSQAKVFGKTNSPIEPPTSIPSGPLQNQLQPVRVAGCQSSCKVQLLIAEDLACATAAAVSVGCTSPANATCLHMVMAQGKTFLLDAVLRCVFSGRQEGGGVVCWHCWFLAQKCRVKLGAEKGSSNNAKNHCQPLVVECVCFSTLSLFQPGVERLLFFWINL